MNWQTEKTRDRIQGWQAQFKKTEKPPQISQVWGMRYESGADTGQIPPSSCTDKRWSGIDSCLFFPNQLFWSVFFSLLSRFGRVKTENQRHYRAFSGSNLPGNWPSFRTRKAPYARAFVEANLSFRIRRELFNGSRLIWRWALTMFMPSRTLWRILWTYSRRSSLLRAAISRSWFLCAETVFTCPLS